MKPLRIFSIIAALLLFTALVITGCSSTPPKPMEDARVKELAPIAEKLVMDIVNIDDAAVYAAFDDAMKKAMPVDKIIELWPQLSAQGGELKSIEGSEGTIIKDYENIIVTVLMEKKTLKARVVFTSDNKVTGLWFNFAN